MDKRQESLNKTRRLTEGGLAIALALILGYITLFQMPQGGAVKAVNLVPLLIYSYRWGGKAGLTASIVYGIVHFILGAKFSLHWASIFLDYICAYGVVGIAGFFGKSHIQAVIGAIIAFICRYIFSVISGAVVFGSYAPAGTNPWIYSLGYNASYMIPDMVLNLIVIILFYPLIMRQLRTIR